MELKSFLYDFRVYLIKFARPSQKSGKTMKKLYILSKSAATLMKFAFKSRDTGDNRRFDQSILDWTNQCKSHLPLVAKPT